jgi:hypothetical protein
MDLTKGRPAVADSTTRPSLETKAEEERDSETQAKADRMPTKDEENAAEGAEDQLDESGARNEGR